MANIKFSYLYRDGGNYKNYDSVVFANPNRIEVSELENLIKSKLVYDTWFYHDEWKLPNLRFIDWNFETDPTWHEFENVEYTDEPPNTSMILSKLIYNIIQQQTMCIDHFTDIGKMVASSRVSDSSGYRPLRGPQCRRRA